MKTLVDTTVWIDFFRGLDAPHVAALEMLLEQGEDVCVCGIVLAEVLQGIREDRAFREVKRRFDDLIYLPMERETFEKAASLYRASRRKGITIRKPLDCMIAATAVEQGAAILHNDRDFNALEEPGGLLVAQGSLASSKQKRKRQ